MFERFADRREAGRMLAEKLAGFENQPDTIVLALPRGGVPVAFEVAIALNLPIDVFTVRKIGAPGHEEFAVGAIATDGIVFIDDHAVHALGIKELTLEEIIEREKHELLRRERLYRGNRPPPVLKDKTVIIVDDGLATGATMRAAVSAVRQRHPKAVIVAVPVCSPVTCSQLERDVDCWCVCVRTPEPFYAVGLWYDNFDQTTDEEVEELLAMADAGGVAARHAI